MVLLAGLISFPQKSVYRILSSFLSWSIRLSDLGKEIEYNADMLTQIVGRLFPDASTNLFSLCTQEQQCTRPHAKDICSNLAFWRLDKADYATNVMGNMGINAGPVMHNDNGMIQRDPLLKHLQTGNLQFCSWALAHTMMLSWSPLASWCDLRSEDCRIKHAEIPCSARTSWVLWCKRKFKRNFFTHHQRFIQHCNNLVCLARRELSKSFQLWVYQR